MLHEDATRITLPYSTTVISSEAVTVEDSVEAATQTVQEVDLLSLIPPAEQVARAATAFASLVPGSLRIRHDMRRSLRLAGVLDVNKALRLIDLVIRVSMPPELEPRLAGEDVVLEIGFAHAVSSLDYLAEWRDRACERLIKLIDDMDRAVA